LLLSETKHKKTCLAQAKQHKGEKHESYKRTIIPEDQEESGDPNPQITNQLRTFVEPRHIGSVNIL